MDLRQLRYFVAVARERNFTRAAETLNIAQPPLSRQIQALEDELGVALLIRNSRPVRLTEAGRLFYEQSIQVLGRVEQMRAATRRVGLNQNSVLSIGFVASTLYGGLPSLLRKLRHRAPEIEIQVLEMASVQQIPALKEGRIDIGFGRLHHPDAGVVGIVLREERLVVAIPRGTPLAQSSDPLPVKALTGQELIVYPKEPRPGYADHVLNLLHGHDVRPSEVHEVREIQTALGLVAAESGLCVVPSSSRQMRSDVHYRLLDGERATTPVILYHRVGDSSPYIDLIKELIRDMYAENPPWISAEHNLPTRPAFVDEPSPAPEAQD
ncbi:MAG: LysR family transcriptional regulator [Rhizobiales bacterium 24-66-13]|jgi:DNA-binding transcriptional LysR family regulator|nr:MAG: LysR family transcriptional regulator [Rhizobiales bacterium 32-66-11]OYY88197.1 MAG: LysR family transcriptional regulator [Rhizobiales bacterium 35-66-30]OYZ81926.1 MAG: LysR family transcriptional regulator [Rhizobiales bacterium 24-66-13]OZB10769.1 MAG: LysR family transcriptional regulator [Rhizobiales bacterium 39-66-18]HQS09805.1 LysR family transcriptional regulator [Xanthobacteraceae bacterium]